MRIFISQGKSREGRKERKGSDSDDSICRQTPVLSLTGPGMFLSVVSGIPASVAASAGQTRRWEESAVLAGCSESPLMPMGWSSSNLPAGCSHHLSEGHLAPTPRSRPNRHELHRPSGFLPRLQGRDARGARPTQKATFSQPPPPPPPGGGEDQAPSSSGLLPGRH